jgi:hypothetical protein
MRSLFPCGGSPSRVGGGDEGWLARRGPLRSPASFFIVQVQGATAAADSAGTLMGSGVRGELVELRPVPISLGY